MADAWLLLRVAKPSRKGERSGFYGSLQTVPVLSPSSNARLRLGVKLGKQALVEVRGVARSDSRPSPQIVASVPSCVLPSCCARFEDARLVGTPGGLGSGGGTCHFILSVL